MSTNSVDKQISDQGRSGKVYHDIPGKLLPGEQIVAKVDALVTRYRAMTHGSGLFLKDFETVWNNQKDVILNFVKDVEIDGKHYYEAGDGDFHLYRSTCRNESFHRRLNHIQPQKCGVQMADTIIELYVVQFNAKRALHVDTYNDPLKDKR